MWNLQDCSKEHVSLSQIWLVDMKCEDWEKILILFLIFLLLSSLVNNGWIGTVRRALVLFGNPNISVHLNKSLFAIYFLAFLQSYLSNVGFQCSSANSIIFYRTDFNSNEKISIEYSKKQFKKSWFTPPLQIFLESLKILKFRPCKQLVLTEWPAFTENQRLCYIWK